MSEECAANLPRLFVRTEYDGTLKNDGIPVRQHCRSDRGLFASRRKERSV